MPYGREMDQAYSTATGANMGLKVASRWHSILLQSTDVQHLLCDNEIKAGECISDATFVPQTDAFDKCH